jgi:TonB family protein
MVGVGCGWLPSAHAAVSPELQKAIRANTFEVVIKKPLADTATYEKPLPLELLPFHERNDAYRSVGTAFALGHNTYVTAAHVFNLAVDSQFGAPELRTAENAVYPVDRILRYSQHEDYVVFSVLRDPAPAGFPVNREPHIDEPVLAVGNALGEGIVIRDGLYTSATDEDQDGLWKWIRFSAAASPGNSGGPLLDADGNVIGIVIGKSPNENLNYSLPIARALVAEEQSAKFNQRVLASLPYLHATYPYTFHDEFKLPLSWPAFVGAYQALMSRHNDEARAGLLKVNAESMFPQGPGSDSLLFDSDPNEFNPFLITQQADGAWGATKTELVSTQLPGDGSVGVGTVAGVSLLRLIRPNTGADDGFYRDSRAFMDLALKALNIRRPIGPDQVRITSLGAAKSDAPFKDHYGRVWQEQVWAVPCLDLYVIGELLPTPDGYAGLISYAPSPFLHEGQVRLRLLTDQLGISLRGSLKQWQAHLRRQALLPDALGGIKLISSPGWTLETPRFITTVPATAVALTEDSVLAVTMGFILDGNHARWGIEDVWWYKDDRMDAAVGLWRRERPPKGAKVELRNLFANMHDRRPPYDGEMIRDTAETFAMTRILEVPGKSAGMQSADLLYGLTLRLVGHPTIADADRALQNAIEGTRIVEHGVGEDVAGAMKVNETADQPWNDSWRQLIAAAEQRDATVGKDIRGRTLSQDLRDFYAAYTARRDTLPVGTSAALDFESEQRQRFQYLEEYWKNYPSLSHNRDMWAVFLSRNGMPADTPHTRPVTEAEESLLRALAGGNPDPGWSDRAHALLAAYIAERSQQVKARHPADSEYRERLSPCPSPAEKTSGKPQPSYSRMNRSLEDYWPIESKRLGEEGIVRVSLRISSTGCALAAAIAGSSGSAMLDEAVLKFYETIDFLPAEVDGKPSASMVILPVVFKLKN